jgi:hypothetical protein
VTVAPDLQVAIASCTTLPEPDPDQAPLSAALEAAGIRSQVLPWDTDRPWPEAPLTVLRSTWNYAHDRDGFLDWATGVDRISRLHNPLDVVRWNTHKRYLLDLRGRGVPVAPTALVPRGVEARCALDDLLDSEGWGRLVIKPAVSAGSWRTLRFEAGDRLGAATHLAGLLRDGDALVQPYLPSVEQHGERALVLIDGELTHAVRKTARFQDEDEHVSEKVSVSPAEADLAAQALHGVPGPLLYARVDMAPGPDGHPVVMELELTEPSLFLCQCPAALERLVQAVARRLQDASRRR